MHSEDLSENIFTALNQIDNFAVLFVDNNYLIQNWCNNLERITGYTEKEAIGKSFVELYKQNEDEVSLIRNLIEKAQLENFAEHIGWRLRKDGSYIWTKSSISSLKNKDGSQKGYLKVVRDLTENQKAEKYKNAVSRIAKMGTWEVDFIKNTVDWSETTGEIHEVEPGYIPDVETGINFYLEGKDRDRIIEVFTKSVKDGTPWNEELRIVTQKGNIKWIQTFGVPEMLNGNCIRVYGTFRDIHEEKLKQLDLNRNIIQFESTFNNSPNGMALVGPNGEWLKINNRICEMLEYSEEELLQITFQDITHPKDLKKDLILLNKLIKNEIKTYEIEKRYFTKSNKIVWVILSVSKVETSEGFYFISQINDITSRKEFEVELKEKNEFLQKQNEALEQFVYITSHDLQEPLRTINSFIGIFNKTYKSKVDATGQKMLGFISESAQRMSSLVKSLLVYNRIGHENLKKEEVNLNIILKEVLDDYKLLIKDVGAEIVSEKLPTAIFYKTELRLIFQNLISNAIKFRRNNEKPKIEISYLERKMYYQFSIKDNGIGIDNGFEDKIFLIFQRLHTRDEYKGSGIGLAHCKKIVELHEGKIWYDSKIGEGTTFHFTLKKD